MLIIQDAVISNLMSCKYQKSE